MENIQTSIHGNLLTITVDLSKRTGPSASGKSIGIASTHGNQTMTTPDGLTFSFGLNVYIKAGRA